MTGGSKLSSLLHNQEITITWCMVSLAVALLQFCTQHENELPLIHSVDQKLVLHCGGHVSSIPQMM